MTVYQRAWEGIAEEAAPSAAQDPTELQLRLELERAARDVPQQRDARAFYNARYALGLYMQMRRGVLTRDV